MMLTGVDYHPSFQQIAFFVEETGECGERRLNHEGFFWRHNQSAHKRRYSQWERSFLRQRCGSLREQH